jgi:hypothetical protein
MLRTILVYLFIAVVTFLIVKEKKFSGKLLTADKSGCVDADNLVMALLFAIVWPFYWFIELMAWLSRVVVKYFKKKDK